MERHRPRSLTSFGMTPGVRLLIQLKAEGHDPAAARSASGTRGAARQRYLMYPSERRFS